jgi:NADH-quinone oxidoreductase subunit A
MEKDARTPIPERRRRTGQAGSRVVSRGVTAGKAVPALILGKPPADRARFGSVAYKNPDPEKMSAYECGFDAFDDARMKFDIRFYLVAILFIIFDLEVAFLFPWAISLKEVGVFGFWSMMIFLGVLTIGFVYEWRKGALEWD